MPAGNFLYISKDSNLPQRVQNLPFVFVDKHMQSKNGAGNVNMTGFRNFMTAVKKAGKKTHASIQKIANKHVLDHGTIYRNLMIDLGLRNAILAQIPATKQY